MSKLAGVEATDFIASGVVVDVMLLDIRMPKKSGVEVMKEANPMPPYPIFAMTGHVDAEAMLDFK